MNESETQRKITCFDYPFRVTYIYKMSISVFINIFLCNDREHPVRVEIGHRPDHPGTGNRLPVIDGGYVQEILIIYIYIYIRMESLQKL